VAVLGGIDLSTKKISVVVLGHEEPYVVELLTEIEHGKPKNKPLGRFVELTTQFAERLKQDYMWAMVERWYIESVGFVRGGRSSLDMAQVLGGVLALLGQSYRDYRLVHTMTWKAHFGIAGAKGKAAKKLAVAKVQAELGLEVPNDDVADAALVALYGSRLPDEG
jgi:Holliday junction resolvasome RuvABC endonuclease subunit